MRQNSLSAGRSSRRNAATSSSSWRGHRIQRRRISPTAGGLPRIDALSNARSTHYRPLSAWLRARRKRSLGRCVRALHVRRAPQTLAPRRNRQGDASASPRMRPNVRCAAWRSREITGSPDRTAGQSDSPHVHAHSEREAKRCGSAAVARRSISPASQLRSKRKSPTRLGHASLTAGRKTH